MDKEAKLHEARREVNRNLGKVPNHSHVGAPILNNVNSPDWQYLPSNLRSDADRISGEHRFIFPLLGFRNEAPTKVP